MARELIGTDRCIGVLVDTPLAVREQRDTEGRYKKSAGPTAPHDWSQQSIRALIVPRCSSGR